jgi:hypothetical protein
MTKEEFKSLFLKLTEYTIPFGEESRLEKYLPSGYKKDSIGNYYYEIGKSETLFTTHLDTYSDKYEKVTHVIEEDPYIIKTDGKTILGGDNKLGCSILIGMIQKGIPGVYYFFLGEEPILSGGLWGSSKALESNPDYFKKFKRCIAFDRREYGSVVVRQKARMCCSNEFAKSIANELKRLADIHWDEAGAYGYYTDTAVFMDVIPECTNVSAGGFKEHYKEEWVDLNYTYNVFKVACQMDFESLPTVRELEVRYSKEKPKSKVGLYNKFIQNKNFKTISHIFDLFDLSITRDITKDGKQHLTGSKWLEDFDFDIYLVGKDIIVNDEVVSIDKLKMILLDVFKEDILEQIEYYLDLIKRNIKGGKKSLDEILDLFDCEDVDDLYDMMGY